MLRRESILGSTAELLYPRIRSFSSEIAGESVGHCHIHLIPRRRGDVGRPKGGVRHVNPNMGHYEAGK